MKLTRNILLGYWFVGMVLIGLLIVLFLNRIDELFSLMNLEGQKELCRIALEYNTSLIPETRSFAEIVQLHNEYRFLIDQMNYIWLLDAFTEKIKRQFLLLLLSYSLISLILSFILFYLIIKIQLTPAESLFKSLELYLNTNENRRIPLTGSRSSRQLISAYNSLLDQLDDLRKRERLTESIQGRKIGIQMVLHELKNSLAPVFLDLEQFEARQRSEANRNFIDRQKHNLVRMERILSQYRTLSQLRMPRLEHLDIAPLADGILERSAVESPQAVVSREGTPFRCISDAEYLETILLNLIRNGLQAGGRDPQVRVLLRPERNTIIVENWGDPIPDDIGSTIFKPGFTTKKGGEGVGLFIVKELCQLLQIRLTWSSSPDSTKFILEFEHD